MRLVPGLTFKIGIYARNSIDLGQWVHINTILFAQILNWIPADIGCHVSTDLGIILLF